MNFEGKYFDGKTSAGYPAQVSLNRFSLAISWREGLQGAKTIEWEPDNIHPNDFAENDKVILKYGEFPFQYVEVNDPGFAKALKETYSNFKFHKSTYNFVFSSGFTGLVVLAVAFLGILALSYFVILPAAAERLAMQMPISWEEQLGDAAFNQIINTDEIDEINSKRINLFFKQLKYKSNYKIDIVVVKDNTVNAFALPGGKIVVYEGILRSMDNYEELTALLSHEFSHVELKHSTKSLVRTLSGALFLSVLFSDASGITAVVIENANQLKQLGYSRSLEEEADQNGLKLMKQRQVDPRGMEQMFEALKREEGSAEVPEFLSTHPLTDKRIKDVKKEIAKKDYEIHQDPSLDSLWAEIKGNLNE